MAILKSATLINAQGCQFDTIEATNIQTIKKWSKGRGGCYTLIVDGVANIRNGIDQSIRFKVKNNRLYEIK
jgi:hypothetical protein